MQQPLHLTHKPTLSDVPYRPFRQQCSETGSDYTKSQTAAKSPENSSGDMNTDEISDMLKKTSLDSAYESLPLNSNLVPNENNSLVESRQLFSQSTEQNQNYSSNRSYNLNSRKSEVTKGPYNECQSRQNNGRRNNSRYITRGSHIERSISEPAFGYRGRGNMSRRGTGRGNRRQMFQKGQSWAGRTADKDRVAVINMIKSPRKPNYIDKTNEAASIEKILFHLDKSVEKSYNCGAIYDKGILYRQTEQHKEALSTFKTLIRNEGGYCSLIQLSNAFEQAGLCIYDILNETGENESLEYDMRTYFKKSIEISCILVSKLPFLKDCWVSAPTLHSFVSGKTRTKEYLKDLAFLNEKFENYGEAINVLVDLKKLTDNEDEKVKIDLKIVENYFSDGNYDDAVLAIDMIMCLPTGYSLIDENLYLRVHINGGFHALKKGDSEMARLRLRNALDFHRCNTVEDESDCEENENDCGLEESSFDVFILCNACMEDEASELIIALDCTKLTATMNFLHVIPGALQLSGIYNIMKQSKHFLIVFGDKPLEKQVLYNYEMMQKVIFERGHGHTVILTTTQNVVLPKHITKLPRIHIEADDTGKINNANVQEKIKELIFKLAQSKAKFEN